MPSRGKAEIASRSPGEAKVLKNNGLSGREN